MILLNLMTLPVRGAKDNVQQQGGQKT